MNEFELRRALRELRRDAVVPPQLWSGIKARIDATRQPDLRTVPVALPARAPRQRWFAALAVAAAAVIAIAIPLHQRTQGDFTTRTPVPAANATGISSSAPSPTSDGGESYAELSAALARNPVLAATDAELRAVERELKRAQLTDPDSAMVQRMLARTRAERRRLLQYQAQLG